MSRTCFWVRNSASKRRLSLLARRICIAFATITDQAKMEKMIRTMMIALPSGVAVVQMRHNSDSAKRQYGTCMRISPTRQAGRWNCANSGSPNGQNVFGFLETSEPFVFKQSKFFAFEVFCGVDLCP